MNFSQQCGFPCAAAGAAFFFICQKKNFQWRTLVSRWFLLRPENSPVFQWLRFLEEKKASVVAHWLYPAAVTRVRVVRAGFLDGSARPDPPKTFPGPAEPARSFLRPGPAGPLKCSARRFAQLAVTALVAGMGQKLFAFTLTRLQLFSFLELFGQPGPPKTFPGPARSIFSPAASSFRKPRWAWKAHSAYDATASYARKSSTSALG